MVFQWPDQPGEGLFEADLTDLSGTLCERSSELMAFLVLRASTELIFAKNRIQCEGRKRLAVGLWRFLLIFAFNTWAGLPCTSWKWLQFKVVFSFKASALVGEVPDRSGYGGRMERSFWMVNSGIEVVIFGRNSVFHGKQSENRVPPNHWRLNQVAQVGLRFGAAPNSQAPCGNNGDRPWMISTDPNGP